MKRSLTILFLVFVLALVQMACSLPGAATSGSSSLITATPVMVGVTTITTTPRSVIIATEKPNPSPTNTRPAPTTTATTDTRITGHGTCTYKATFVSDSTIPDDTVVAADSTFVKTWTVRNDGTCAWGPNGYALHGLAFAGGSQMGAPSVIPLHTTVQPGQTIDVSVTLTAPSTPGTYTSNWMFRVDNDPNGVGPNLGLGPNGDQPLFTRIQVSGGDGNPSFDAAGRGGLTRLQFEPGTTTTIVTGSLGPNETRGYLVAARQDQVIIAGTPLQDWEGGVRVKVTTSDNVALTDLVDNLSFVASLPETRDYIVWISGGSHATSYHLAVTIPIRITFDAGAVSASMDGAIRNGREILYVLRAAAGQTLTASLDGSNVSLIVTGLENPQLLASSTSHWTGALPTTQDYIIQVMPAVESTTYTLHVTVQ